ncbi:MAG: hypothetical protein JW955_10740 [Sedimentisphaerales bacterium]|nr:hypothetical protein [Sedimentisphaerales bacterium]
MIVYSTQLFRAAIPDTMSRMTRLIRTVFTNDGLLVANNLLSGPGLSNESDRKIEITGNLIEDLTPALVDPMHGNLHLTEAATERDDATQGFPRVSPVRMCPFTGRRS